MPWDSDDIEYEHSFRWEEEECGMGTFDSQVTVNAVAMGFFTGGKATEIEFADDCSEEETGWLLHLMGLLRKIYQ